MEKGLSTTKLPYEAGKRPKRAKPSDSGNHCQTAKALNTKWIKRPRLKQTLFFFIFQKPQKEKWDGFKIYPDFGKEKGKINSMKIMHSCVSFILNQVA